MIIRVPVEKQCKQDAPPGWSAVEEPTEERSEDCFGPRIVAAT